MAVAVDTRLHVFGYNTRSGKAKLWRIDFRNPSLKGITDLTMLDDWTSFSEHRFFSGGQIIGYNAVTGLARGFRVLSGASDLQWLWTDVWPTGYR